MKTIVSFLLSFLFFPFFVEAQEITSPPIKHAIPFSAGEKLTYRVKYGFLVGGTAIFSLSEQVYQEKAVFYAKAIGQSSGIANTIYRVKDSYESWFDKETTLPYKQVRNIREGHYTLYNEVTYNRRNNTINSKLSGKHKVPEKILDLCSLFYYIRRIDFSKLENGDVISLNMYFADGIFPSHIKYLGKETIKTANGKVRCIKVSPLVEVGRMFSSQDDLDIWFTDDESCLPALVRMDLRVVGAVSLKLVKFENVVDSLIVQKKNP